MKRLSIYAVILGLLVFSVFLHAGAQTVSPISPWQFVGSTSTVQTIVSSSRVIIRSNNLTDNLGNKYVTSTGAGSSTINIGGISSTTFNLGFGLSISATGTILFINQGYITTSTDLTVANFSSPNISQWTNNSGFISTSTGLTTSNFTSPNISQWTNNSGYIVTSTGLTTTNFATTSVGQWVNNGLYATTANNLSDLASSTAARGNLGLGTSTQVGQILIGATGGAWKINDPTGTNGIEILSGNGTLGIRNSQNLNTTGTPTFASLITTGNVNASGTLTVEATTTVRGKLLDASGNAYSTSTGGGAITINGFPTSTFTFSGTSNQITITQSPSGTFTWAAPQNISAASNPQFARLGLGQAISNEVLNINSNLNPSGDVYGIRVQGLYRPTANNNAYGFNLGNTFQTSNSVGTSSLYAGMFIQSSTITNTSGTVTESAALYINGTIRGATNEYAIHVASGTSRFDKPIEMRDPNGVFIWQTSYAASSTGAFQIFRDTSGTTCTKLTTNAGVLTAATTTCPT